MVKKDTCRGAVQCKWTDFCDGRTQQHYCIFQPIGPTGPLSGRLSEGFQDIFMAKAKSLDPTSYPSGTITSQRIDNAYREDHLFLPVLKRQCHKIFCFGFFHESSSPKPLKIPLGSFQICSKIRWDICQPRCTTCINGMAANFDSGTTGVNDTGGKFAAGVSDTGGK
jgi:hypothetical protein